MDSKFDLSIKQKCSFWSHGKPVASQIESSSKELD